HLHPDHNRRARLATRSGVLARSRSRRLRASAETRPTLGATSEDDVLASQPPRESATSVPMEPGPWSLWAATATNRSDLIAQAASWCSPNGSPGRCSTRAGPRHRQATSIDSPAWHGRSYARSLATWARAPTFAAPSSRRGITLNGAETYAKAQHLVV